MKNTFIESNAQRKLTELENEVQSVIDMYLKQVAADANAPIIKDLQIRLKSVRNEQWKILESQYVKNTAPQVSKVAQAA